MKGLSFTAADRRVRLSLRLLILGYGCLSYLIFLGTFLYAIGFVGDLVVPKSIDSGSVGSSTDAVVVDLLLLGLFAVPHSIMARPAFKRWWTRLVPLPAERGTYVLASSLLLDLLFWQWCPMPKAAWEFRHSAIAAVLWILSAAGWLLVLGSSFLIDHFDLFGLRQAYLYALGWPYTPPLFRTPGLYHVVRHPIMLGFLIAFWATPRMTVGHLIFAVLTTVYILIGAHLEERDLKAAYGDVYEAYRRRVPMLIPRIGRSASN